MKKTWLVVLLVCCSVYAIVSSAAIGIFAYNYFGVKYFLNAKKNFAELDYIVNRKENFSSIIDTTDNTLRFYDIDTHEEKLVFSIDDTSPFSAEWIEVESISDNYVVEHRKNDLGMFSDYFNCMVADRLLRLNHQTMTADVVYEITGSNRILYACDEYLILYSAEKNACQWVDYVKNSVICEEKINLNLRRHREYTCIYDNEAQTLTITQSRFDRNDKEIAVLNCS